MALTAPPRPTPALARQDRWEETLRRLVKGGVIPQDGLHVTALLEMNGWNDRRARTEFGFSDLFEMGEELFRQVQARISNRVMAGPDPYPWYTWVRMSISYYLRGLMFAMPMVISVVAMLINRFSLWSYQDFSPELATGIFLGTMGSFLATGGFTQAVARRGLFYISQREYSLARRTSLWLIFAGLIFSVGVGAAFCLLNMVVPLFSWDLILFAMPYYLFLSILWLAITILYMLKEEIVFSAIIAGGIAVVWYIFRVRGGTIREAQMIGLSLSTLASLATALYLFWRMERRQDAGAGDAPLPRWSQVARTLVPYFVFGLLYFGFLYLDRVVAWSVPSAFGVHPYPIWFEGTYELGLDWAILTLVAPMGMLELYINVFVKRLEYWQSAMKGLDWKAFNRRFQRAYLVQVITMWILSALGGWLIWWVMGPNRSFGLLQEVDFFANEVTGRVFVLGTISYVFVSTGLLNCLMLFSLNFPWPSVRSVGLALMTDLLVGFIASRIGHFSYAVWGLLCGSIVFALYSGFEVNRNMSRLDYVLYRMV